MSQFKSIISNTLKRGRTGLILLIALLLALQPLTLPVNADTAPATGVPATVSADPLPTVQVNGIVFAQVTVGNTVYATGRFTQATPSGVAIGGAGSVARSNLLAYDITTGNLISSFTAGFSGTGATGYAIAASPDGTKLYVGGRFTSANGSGASGQPRSNIAAFDIPSGTLINGFTSGTSGGLNNGEVRTIATTSSNTYIGGLFTSAGGQPRSKIAAYNSSGTLMSSWNPSVTSTDTTHSRLMVSAMVAMPSNGNLVFGGYFDRVNGIKRYSHAAVNLTTGALVTPWASESDSYPVRQQLSAFAENPNDTVAYIAKTRYTSMTTDGTQVFITAMFDGRSYIDGATEGRISINPTNGNINWLNDCYGNTWSSLPIGQVLYTAGHSHECSSSGAYTELGGVESKRTFAAAETTYITGVNGPNRLPERLNLSGIPRNDQLHWYPQITGVVEGGMGEVVWSLTGNASYISLGGAFNRVSGQPQQGLTRYAIRSIAPNTRGPVNYTQGAAIYSMPAGADGVSRSYIIPTYDHDNETLTYTYSRVGSSKSSGPIEIKSAHWKRPVWTFTDCCSQPGTSAQYRLIVKDPLGNKLDLPNVSVINDSDPRILYGPNQGWQTYTDPISARYERFARDSHYSSMPGAGFTYHFTGTYVKLIAEKGPARGNVEISIDGGPRVTVSAYSDTVKFQQTIFEQGGLAQGAHNIRVYNGGTGYIDVDAIMTR